MSIFNTRAVKLEENDEYLIYAYGENYNEVAGRFKYYKTRFDVDILNYEDEKLKWNAIPFGVAVKIKRFYDEKGYYPDDISRQA